MGTYGNWKGSTSFERILELVLVIYFVLESMIGVYQLVTQFLRISCSLVVLANVVGMKCTSTNMASFIKANCFVAKNLGRLLRYTQVACIYTFLIVPIVLSYCLVSNLTRHAGYGAIPI